MCRRTLEVPALARTRAFVALGKARQHRYPSLADKPSKSRLVRLVYIGMRRHLGQH